LVREQAYIFFSIVFALTAAFGSEIWTHNLRQYIPDGVFSESVQQLIPAELPVNLFIITTALLLPVTEFYDSFSRVLTVTGTQRTLHLTHFVTVLPCTSVTVLTLVVACRIVRAFPGAHPPSADRPGSHCVGFHEHQPDLRHPEAHHLPFYRRHL
jgi:hypothetical protein